MIYHNCARLSEYQFLVSIFIPALNIVVRWSDKKAFTESGSIKIMSRRIRLSQDAHASSFFIGLLRASVEIRLPWAQGYDPTHHWWLSTVCAALPLAALLIALLGPRLKAHISALIALAVALVVVIAVFHMPTGLAFLSTAYGAAYGLFPIFWIIFPVIFMYQLTIRSGRFGHLQECLVGVTQDSRLQLLLIAFAFGAFFEGAAGFGTPVAVCGTILLGLGFSPLEAAGLTLLANTAPVAFGGLGIPVIALHGVTGLDTRVLTRVVSTLVAPFCVIEPFWLIWAFAGFKKMLEVWPAILLTGVTFGLTQLLVARLHGPWLVDIAVRCHDGCAHPISAGVASEAYPERQAPERCSTATRGPWLLSHCSRSGASLGGACGLRSSVGNAKSFDMAKRIDHDAPDRSRTSRDGSPHAPGSFLSHA